MLKSPISCEWLVRQGRYCLMYNLVTKIDLMSSLNIPLIFFISIISSGQNTNMKRLHFYKKLFAFSLFSGTLGLAWYLKKQKGKRLKNLLEDCTRLPVNEELFGAEVSFYK